MAMHLASMVHSSGRDREVHDRHFQQQQQQHHLAQQHAAYYQQTQQQQHHQHQQQQQQQHVSRPYGLPTSVPASHYTQPQPQVVDYQYQRHPQSPPSPPVEDQKPSLPSISSLLHIADAEKPASETSGQSPKSQHDSPQLSQQRPLQQSHQPVQQESRPVSNPRMTLPPTPPMHPDPAVDGNQSPSAASNHSASGPYYLGQSLNNVEPHLQRQNGTNMQNLKREVMTPQVSMSPYNASAYVPSPYASSPGANSATSFYSPEPHYPSMGMYSQRPLPSNFQPQTMPLPVPSPTPNGQNPWQHHHYISASSQSAFPQSQDRYICSTCNKAFSRPSSLRIHSHSHTGEKPYKCPQPGCGKAFSVRSNMKRHERGCHASTSATLST